MITKADRNPLITHQAYVYYTSLGSPSNGTYSVVGIPGGGTVTVNTKGKYFIVSNIQTAKAIKGVSIKLYQDGGMATSNSIDIPSIL